MQNLYINGAFVGKVKGRRKRGGDIEAWSFLMDGGYFTQSEYRSLKEALTANGMDADS